MTTTNGRLQGRDDLSRREFLRTAGMVGVIGAASAAGAAGILGAFAAEGGKKKRRGGGAAAADKPAKGFKDPNQLDKRLAVVHGTDAAAMTRKALELLGGMDKLVSAGNRVVIKPNIGWNKAPAIAANTNPAIVVALIELCVEAGAAEVQVFDFPVDAAEQTYVTSGIKAAVEEAAGRLAAKAKIAIPFIDRGRFRSYSIPGASTFQSFGFYAPALECDVLINVPVLKNHGGSGVTIGLKNMMGLIDDRGRLHGTLQEGIVDINRLVAIDLTVLDAMKAMLSGGPRGDKGGASQYKETRTVVAGIDRVAIDAYGLELMGRAAGSVSHIREASGALEIPGGEKGSADWKARGILEETV